MKKVFRFSFARPEQFHALGRRKLAAFSGCELPGELLTDDLRLAASPDFYCGVRDLAAPQLARLIPYENLIMRSEFSRFFAKRCRTAAKVGATYVTADFDLAHALGNAGMRQKLQLFLKGLFGILAENHLMLLVPVRLPAVADGVSAREIRDFCRTLLYPGIGIFLDFHPHEPGAFDFAGTLRELRFDAQYWRIFFEPERSNQLTVPLLEKLFAALEETETRQVEISIAPGNTIPDSVALASLSETIAHFTEEA